MPQPSCCPFVEEYDSPSVDMRSGKFEWAGNPLSVPESLCELVALLCYNGLQFSCLDTLLPTEDVMHQLGL